MRKSNGWEMIFFMYHIIPGNPDRSMANWGNVSGFMSSQRKMLRRSGWFTMISLWRHWNDGYYEAESSPNALGSDIFRSVHCHNSVFFQPDISHSPSHLLSISVQNSARCNTRWSNHESSIASLRFCWTFSVHTIFLATLLGWNLGCKTSSNVHNHFCGDCLKLYDTPHFRLVYHHFPYLELPCGFTPFWNTPCVPSLVSDCLPPVPRSTLLCCIWAHSEHPLKTSAGLGSGPTRSRHQTSFLWVCLKIVYPMTQWFCWSLSPLNGYDWGYTQFSDIPLLVRDFFEPNMAGSMAGSMWHLVMAMVMAIHRYLRFHETALKRS